jgi:hypothetical protein
MQQVTERLDKLILQIKKIQEPYMLEEKPVDIVLVRFSSLSSPVGEHPCLPYSIL